MQKLSLLPPKREKQATYERSKDTKIKADIKNGWKKKKKKPHSSPCSKKGRQVKVMLFEKRTNCFSGLESFSLLQFASCNCWLITGPPGSFVSLPVSVSAEAPYLTPLHCWASREVEKRQIKNNDCSSHPRFTVTMKHCLNRDFITVLLICREKMLAAEGEKNQCVHSLFAELVECHLVLLSWWCCHPVC